MKENLSFLVTPDQKTYFEEREIPTPKADEVVIKTAVTGICGSDVHVYLHGKIGVFGIDQPIVLGHESSGVITAAGGDVKKLKVGQRVVVEPGIPCRFCKNCAEGRYNLCENYVFMSSAVADGTFQKYFAVREDMVHPIPDSMSDELGALVEPTAVALHVLRRGGEITGKTIAIFGAGPIGMLIGMTAKALGCAKVILIDINQDRLDTALTFCADEVINSMTQKVGENLADIVFESAGSPICVNQAFTLAKPGGRIVQVGWLKKDVAEINISIMLSKEQEYVASLNYANEFPMAIALLANGSIDAQKIVTHRYPFEKTAEAFANTVENPKETLKTLVKF